MNRTTSVIVAIIAAATLSTIGITVPHQQALAWGRGLGNGGILVSPPVLAGVTFDPCCGGCGGGC
jgi:hypothetical protein